MNDTNDKRTNSSLLMADVQIGVYIHHKATSMEDEKFWGFAVELIDLKTVR